MPVCDGFEFLRRRNTDKFLSTIPVIVMTGSNSKDVELQCLDLGAVDFIPKPYNFKLVMAGQQCDQAEGVRNGTDCSRT